MEEDEVQQCWRCHMPITEGHAKTELPCHHFLHTNCFVEVIHHGLFANCVLCDQIFNPHQHMEDNYQTDNHQHIERERICQLYDTNPRFKEIAKKLVKQKALCSKTRIGVQKLIKQKKGEVREQLLLIKAQLEGITSLKKNEVQTSQQYKDYMKAKRSYAAAENKLQRDHNCSAKLLSRALREKPGFKRFNARHRWFHYSYYLFHRPWRYRVPV
jgi:hypothetical protein